MAERKKITLPALFSKLADGQRLTMVTCYDFSMASLVEQAAIDIVLVGDSLGMTMLGYEGTLPVTMDDMIRHAAAVRRGTPNAWLIGDMPYMSYQPGVETAIRNAGRFMAEAACDCVKLEGGAEMLPQVRAIVGVGIPVVGHLGLTPQSASAIGGYRVQGRDPRQAKRIVDDARALEDAGAFAVILEMVPDRVCQLITQRTRSSFTIGLGSGPSAHGQLLIFHDMFGLYPRFKPRMAKVFADAGSLIRDGLMAYARDVADGAFPQPENYFTIGDEAYGELLRQLGEEHAGSALSTEPG